MTETGQSDLSLTTDHGTLAAKDMGKGLTSVNMGLPGLAWQDIPLSEAVDTLSLPIDGAPVATGMGNPHCTFFVEDVEAVDPGGEDHQRRAHHLVGRGRILDQLIERRQERMVIQNRHR